MLDNTTSAPYDSILRETKIRELSKIDLLLNEESVTKDDVFQLIEDQLPAKLLVTIED